MIYLIHDDMSNQSKKKSAVAAELDVMTDACLLELSSSVSVSLSLFLSLYNPRYLVPRFDHLSPSKEEWTQKKAS